MLQLCPVFQQGYTCSAVVFEINFPSLFANSTVPLPIEETRTCILISIPLTSGQVMWQLSLCIITGSVIVTMTVLLALWSGKSNLISALGIYQDPKCGGITDGKLLYLPRHRLQSNRIKWTYTEGTKRLVLLKPRYNWAKNESKAIGHRHVPLISAYPLSGPILDLGAMKCSRMWRRYFNRLGWGLFPSWVIIHAWWSMISSWAIACLCAQYYWQGKLCPADIPHSAKRLADRGSYLPHIPFSSGILAHFIQVSKHLKRYSQSPIWYSQSLIPSGVIIFSIQVEVNTMGLPIFGAEIENDPKPSEGQICMYT